MIPTLLQNEKVRKFFGCGKFCLNAPFCPQPSCEAWMALRVLAAMSERIEKGTKVLASDQNGDHCEWKERVVGEEAGMLFNATQEFHPGYLVLPDQFQPQRPPSGCEPSIKTENECLWDAIKALDSQDMKLNERLYALEKTPRPADEWKCYPGFGPNGKDGWSKDGVNFYPFKPSPTPPEPKDKWASKWCCMEVDEDGYCPNPEHNISKPEPRGEFGEDVVALEKFIAEQIAYVSTYQIGFQDRLNEISIRLRSFLRLSRAGKGA